MHDYDIYGIEVTERGNAECGDGDAVHVLFADALEHVNETALKRWWQRDFPDETYSVDAKNAYFFNDTWGSNECKACLMGDFSIMALRNFPPLEDLDLIQIQQVAREVYEHLGASEFVSMIVDRIELDLPIQFRYVDFDDDDIERMEHEYGGDVVRDKIVGCEDDHDKSCNLESIHQIVTRDSISQLFARAIRERTNE